jgi:hypothetical protein
MIIPTRDSVVTIGLETAHFDRSGCMHEATIYVCERHPRTGLWQEYRYCTDGVELGATSSGAHGVVESHVTPVMNLYREAVAQMSMLWGK